MIRKALTLAAFAAALATSAFAGADSRTGQFTGASNHVTSGGVTVTRDASGYIVQLGPQFFLDGAPDPVIGFGNDGRYDTASQFTELNKKRGQQRYDLPADFVPSQYSEVYVWCEQFAVPLGVATLN
jgi:hypothetical protein